jgi:hypothetical protein
MADQNWAELFESVEHIPPDGDEVPKPTDEVLDRYEHETSFRFPKSYREFIKVFGPGELGEEYVIRAPGYFRPEKSPKEERFNLRTDLGRFNQRIREQQIKNDTVKRHFAGDALRVSRLVYFAETSIGELIGWDPLDTRDADLAEYGIYILLRESDHLALFSENFTDLINEVFFGVRYVQLTNPSTTIPKDTSGLLLPKSFRPAGF